MLSNRTFQNTGNKKKNPTNFQREKAATKVSNNLSPICPLSRSCWREYSTKVGVNQERGGLGIQDIGKPVLETGVSCVQDARTSVPGRDRGKFSKEMNQKNISCA